MPVNRLGPPVPRNEPWRPPVPPLPEQPGRLPVPARDAQGAFVQWLKATGRFDQGYDIGQRAEAKSAFAAGFRAGQAVPVNHEPTRLDTGSLFPTMGLDHDC